MGRKQLNKNAQWIEKGKKMTKQVSSVIEVQKKSMRGFEHWTQTRS